MMSKMNGRRHLILPTCVLLLLGLSGCTTTAHHSHASRLDIPPQTEVLVMPPDIQLFEMTAGGLEEPRADWTQAAQKHFMDALHQKMATSEDTVLLYEPPALDRDNAYDHQQLIKLHEVVGEAIMLHAYISYFALPTKKTSFDWSLGENVQSLRAYSHADYAMFIFIRDSYTSGGRTAAIIGAALLGVGLPGGQQRGFASLVDLKTGQIIWFNRMLRAQGDLRTPEPARKTLEYLLKGCPL